jgi:hypothetical protein
MSIMRAGAIALLLMLFKACAPLPPTPEDLAAKKFEPSPGQAVIYLVRESPDLSYLTAPVVLNDDFIGSTQAGTYFRLEVPPGRHQIRGYGADSGTIRIDTQAGRIYFVRQRVGGSFRVTNPTSFFSLIGEDEGRAAVMRSVRAG